MSLFAKFRSGTASKDFIGGNSRVTDGDWVVFFHVILPTKGFPFSEEISIHCHNHCPIYTLLDILSQPVFSEEDFSLRFVTPVPVREPKFVVTNFYLDLPLQPQEKLSVPRGKSRPLMSIVGKSRRIF